MSGAGSGLVYEEQQSSRACPPKLCAVVVARDPFVCERIRGWLSSSSLVDVAADAVTAPEAVSVIQRHRPSLVFLDLDVTVSLHHRRLRLARALPHIVFLVSNREQTFTLRRLPNVQFLDVHCSREECLKVTERFASAQDLHLEPVNLRRILAFLTGRRGVASKRVTFRSGNNFILLEHDEIDWIEVGGDGNVVVHAGSEAHNVSGLTAALEAKLKKRPFVALSQGVLVNVNQIREVRLQPGATHMVVLHNGIELPLTRSYVGKVLAEVERSGN